MEKYQSQESSQMIGSMTDTAIVHLMERMSLALRLALVPPLEDGLAFHTKQDMKGELISRMTQTLFKI